MVTEQRKSSIQGTVAFTGRLASMKRAEAAALVQQHGGTPRRGVTKSTDLLVVGELGWPLLPDGQPSDSLSRAKQYGVPIASERRFLEMLGRSIPDDQLRTHTLERISSLSGLPGEVIEELATFGLLDPRDGLYRFRDLGIARQVAELFEAGITLSTITRSLNDIRKWLPDAGLTNVRLYPASKDAVLIEHLKVRTDKSGQFVLPMLETQDSPDALFEQAQAAEGRGDTDLAARLYRKIISVEPGDPAAAFNLGNLLAGTGKKVEAEAAFRAALKADSQFAEAWYNLANVLDDQGPAHKAIDALQRSLAIDPDYADALFNLALLLQRNARHAEAATIWRRYIALDNQSDWSARAKRALKLCEMQIAQSS